MERSQRRETGHGAGGEEEGGCLEHATSTQAIEDPWISVFSEQGLQKVPSRCRIIGVLLLALWYVWAFFCALRKDGVQRLWRMPRCR